MKLLWKILLLLVVLAGAGYGLYAYLGSQPNSTLGRWYTHWTGHKSTLFRTSPVVKQDVLSSISATGTVEPEETIDVGAQVAGQILRFGKDPRNPERTIDYGTPVEVDTELAFLDQTLYQSRVAQAKANLERSKAGLLQMDAKLMQASRDWDRARELGPTRIITPADVDLARANFKTAEANVADAKAAILQAEANLQEADVNLGYTVIRSPVKGVILDRRVNVGQTVVASLNAPSLFLIAKDLRRMQVWASVNEADIGTIKPGQTVSFTVDAYPNQTFTGKVAPDQPRLNASMTQNVVTYTVVVATENEDLKLKPYLTANLKFEIEKHSDVLAVPNSALRWTPKPEQIAPDAREIPGSQRKKPAANAGEKPAAGDKEKEQGTVWIEDDGYVRPIKVHLGLTDGTMTEVLGDDLKEGANLVVGEIHQGPGQQNNNPFAPQMFRGNQNKDKDKDKPPQSR
jgi:HlyD family secretion protein